jgi:hypothetical protein
MYSDFDWIENKNLKLGSVSDFYIEECENNIPRQELKEEEFLVSFVNKPNSDMPVEIPCYREIRTKKQKFKKRAKKVKIELTPIESEVSEDNEIIGCVNPGLYINVLEEEVPGLMEQQQKRIKAKGFADDAGTKTDKEKITTGPRKEKEFEEFNIYENTQFNSQVLKKVEKKLKVHGRKKIRPSKSQNALLETNEPFEVILEEIDKKKRKTGLELGFEEDEIDPFGNDTFVVVQDYDTLTKNKNREYHEQSEGKWLWLTSGVKKKKKVFSLRDEIQRRKFESENSDIFESLKFDDLDKLGVKRRDSLDLNSEFNILQRKKTIEVDF